MSAENVSKNNLCRPFYIYKFISKKRKTEKKYMNHMVENKREGELVSSVISDDKVKNERDFIPSYSFFSCVLYIRRVNKYKKRTKKKC